MLIDVSLRIEEKANGVSTVVDVRLEVNQAPSGFYIASNPIVSPVIGSGGTPRDAVLDFLGNMFFHRTVETEQGQGNDKDQTA